MDRLPLATEMLPTAWADEILTAELAEMAAVDADIDMHLVTSSTAWVPGTVFGDLTIASYAGYATKTVSVASFTVFQTESDGSRRVQSTLLTTWNPPSADGPVTIYGIAYTEGGATTKLYRLHRFDQPVILSVGGSHLNHIATITERAGEN